MLSADLVSNQMCFQPLLVKLCAPSPGKGALGPGGERCGVVGGGWGNMLQYWNMFQYWTMFQYWNMFQSWTMVQDWNVANIGTKITRKIKK